MYDPEVLGRLDSAIEKASINLASYSFHRQRPHDGFHYPEVTWASSRRRASVGLRQIIDEVALKSWDLLFIAGKVPVTVYTIPEDGSAERDHVLRSGDEFLLETMRSLPIDNRENHELFVGSEDPDYDGQGLYISLTGLGRSLAATTGRMGMQEMSRENSCLIVQGPYGQY